MEIQLTDEEFVDEVRNALAKLDAKKIPDSTILQARDRFVVPIIENQLAYEIEPSLYESVVIAYSAERSFDAFYSKTRMSDAEITIEVDPEVYREQLQSRTDDMLSIVDIRRPDKRVTKRVVTADITQPDLQ